jgi:hypothetical protein
MTSQLRVALALVACGAAVRAQEPAGVAPSPRAPEAVVETEAGSFVIRLLPDLAPRHVEHFVATARKGGYEGPRSTASSRAGSSRAAIRSPRTPRRPPRTARAGSGC